MGSLQYYFVPVRRDKSWHLGRTNRFCVKKTREIFLRSQPHVPSYSILNNKHMVLFCCLKNMKICAVITNICVHRVSLSRVPDTFGHAEATVRSSNAEERKKKVVEPPEKQKPDPTGLWSAFPREIAKAESGCVLVTDVSVVGMKSISAMCVVGLGALSLLSPCILWYPPPDE